MESGYIKDTLDVLDIHKSILANKLGVCVKTIELWARNEEKINRIARERIDSMTRIHLLEKELLELKDDFIEFLVDIDLKKNEDINKQKTLLFKILKSKKHSIV